MEKNYDAIVIGSGFGGTIMALTIAREFYLESHDDNGNQIKTPRHVLLLERGTWWTTPVGTVADKEVAAYSLLKSQKQPVQFWPSNNSIRGVIDILTRCVHHEGNVDGLYEMTGFGWKGLLGLFGKNDGLTVLRASGVGGGSLVYSNITVQPPALIFNDSRWAAMNNWKQKKDNYYKAARTAIGTGVLKALLDWDETHNPDVFKRIMNSPKLKSLLSPKVNTGLSQIVTRNAGINPHWKKTKDPITGDWVIPKNDEDLLLYQIDDIRKGKKIQNIKDDKLADPKIIDDERDMKNDLWIDRARIFHEGMQKLPKELSVEFSAHDLSINDSDTLPLQMNIKDVNGNEVKAGDNVFDHATDSSGGAKNYCERQGRCNVGCLPGARHTLNKQLMGAVLGKADLKRDANGNITKDADGDVEVTVTPGVFKDILEIKPLCEVDYINKIADNDYEIQGWQHNERSRKIWRSKEKFILKTKKVIVSAGCLGTNEIMLKSKQKGGLKNLSEKLGFGFSPNGDNFYFLGKTREKIRSTRGPVQSSHAHFNLKNDPGLEPTNENLFHMVEDLGIPPAFATTVGFGQSLFKVLATGRHKFFATLTALIGFIFKRVWTLIMSPFRNRLKRQDVYRNEDEVSSNYMIVTTTGREQAIAQIKLGRFLQTPLRMERKKNGKDELFMDDPVYKNIANTLNQEEGQRPHPNLAAIFADDKAEGDDKKFITPTPKTVACSHPLGGCRIAADSLSGVVNEFGHVFDTSKGIHEGLYIADASVIPTALGVNPSLSISAVCWHIADNIRKELGGQIKLVKATESNLNLVTV